MSTLSTIAKREVPEAYKKMVEAGYLNSELKITKAGRTMLDHIVLQTNEKAMVEAADARIAEQNAAAKSGEKIADEGEAE